MVSEQLQHRFQNSAISCMSQQAETIGFHVAHTLWSSKHGAGVFNITIKCTNTTRSRSFECRTAIRAASARAHAVSLHLGSVEKLSVQVGNGGRRGGHSTIHFGQPRAGYKSVQAPFNDEAQRKCLTRFSYDELLQVSEHDSNFKRLVGQLRSQVCSSHWPPPMQPPLPPPMPPPHATAAPHHRAPCHSPMPRGRPCHHTTVPCHRAMPPSAHTLTSPIPRHPPHATRPMPP